jgi:hypothetical protein
MSHSDSFDWSAWKERQSVPKRKPSRSEQKTNIEKNRLRRKYVTDSTPGFVPKPRSEIENVRLRKRRSR